jgi:hypothetical protein
MDLDEWLGALEPDGVIELHLSGGSQSDPAWLESRRVFRVDSHDAPVPEPVWGAFERHLSRFRNLRGVVVERLDGTIERGTEAEFEAEVRRAKEVWGRCR